MRKHKILMLLAVTAAAGTLVFAGCEKQNTDNEETAVNTDATEPSPSTDAKEDITDISVTPTAQPTPTEVPEATPVPTMPGEGLSTGGNQSPFNGQVKTDADVIVTDVKSRIVKNFDFSDGSDKNKVLVIASLEELNAYIAEDTANYDLDTKYGSESFEEAVKAYDEAFFKDHDLILVRFTSSSGSTTYTVSGVRFSTDEFTGKRTVRPVIESHTPEIFTCDMAYYHVIIEISKEYGASECETLSPVSGPEFDNESEAIGTEKD